jgi:DNA-directed RNA polymerase subunit RPC12/RpoP
MSGYRFDDPPKGWKPVSSRRALRIDSRCPICGARFASRIMASDGQPVDCSHCGKRLQVVMANAISVTLMAGEV